MSDSGFLEPWAKATEETYTASTQFISSCTQRHKAAQWGKHHVAKTCFSLHRLPGTGRALGLSSLHNTMLNLGSISLLGREEQAGQGSRVKLTGNKLNQSRTVTKGTRNISTVSHPTGWPQAQNFHYNFSKGRRKGRKKCFRKTLSRPQPRMPLSHNQKSEKLAFQGVKTQHWILAGLYMVGGVLKTTTVLHWSLQASQIINGFWTTEKGGQS